MQDDMHSEISSDNYMDDDVPYNSPNHRAKKAIKEVLQQYSAWSFLLASSEASSA